MGEPAASERRRTFVPGLSIGVVSATILAIAGNQAWVQPASDSPTTAEGQVAAIAADASSPLTTAVALVVLASWGVLLVTRGGFRSAIAWLTAVGAGVLVAVVLLGWRAAPGELTDLMATYGMTDADVTRTWWCWLAVATSPFALAAGLLAVRDVRSWPQMGSRYDAPGAQQEADSSAKGPDDSEERSSIDLWKSLDEGADPTE